MCVCSAHEVDITIYTIQFAMALEYYKLVDINIYWGKYYVQCAHFAGRLSAVQEIRQFDPHRKAYINGGTWDLSYYHQHIQCGIQFS